MNTSNRRHLARTGALLALASLAACKTQPTRPDNNAKPVVQETRGAVIMPAGANHSLVTLAEKGIKPKLYTQVRGIGMASNGKLLLRPEVLASLALTDEQIQRRFMDTIGKTKRYEVYDMGGSVVAEASDYVVDAQFVDARQQLRPLDGGARVAVTRVQINANLVHRYTGKPVWDAPVEAVGITGQSSGDRQVLMPGMNPNDARVQQMLGNDYNEAMQRALDVLARRIDRDLRPMGKVVGTQGDGISIIGGQRNGLQRGDELVVFRAGLTKIGDQQEFINMQPLVAVRCNGVGSATSQCDVVRRNPGFTVQVGDYVILTDHSADGGRSGL